MAFVAAYHTLLAPPAGTPCLQASGPLQHASLCSQLEGCLPSGNIFYAMRVRCSWLNSNEAWPLHCGRCWSPPPGVASGPGFWPPSRCTSIGAWCFMPSLFTCPLSPAVLY